MNPTAFLQALPGPFHFLRSDPEEIRRLIPDLAKTLPFPQRIFLDNEEETPLRGIPILLSDGLSRMRKALQGYVLAEEEIQVAIQGRKEHDRKAYQQAWERYRQLLSQAVENVTLSSYGRKFPAIFWLHHSLDLARLLKETPRRAVRRDLQIGRQYGDLIKYRVLDRYLDRVFHATYELVSRLAVDTEEAEEELFPRILTRMRDNVLILTEDHISPDLAELTSYFAGHLGIDGRDLRQRLKALQQWHGRRFQADTEIQDIARHLLGDDPQGLDPDDLLKRSGYLAYLATRHEYDPRKLPDSRQIQIWESLLVKLKEFELFHQLRRFLVPAKRDGERLLGRPSQRSSGQRLEATLGGSSVGAPVVVLSDATRPMDFLAPWVVDPLVDRFGLIYDLTDFSQIVSMLRRAGSDLQDLSFRKMFRFQRRINQLAAAHRMKLEKYLGDGAFYSSRRALPLLHSALQIQRYYRQELDEGFPFDKGMRIAINYGQYRIIPIGRGPDEEARYEFFGHSLVELSRLTTGKASRDIDEIKTLLMSYGYPEQAVYRFFEPLQHKEAEMVDPREDVASFRAYINRNGSLVNEGIVATEAYLRRLSLEATWSQLRRGTQGRRTYVVVPLGDDTPSESKHEEKESAVGIRRLGLATLKGLEKVPVFEIVDADSIDRGERLAETNLLSALEQVASAAGRDTGAAAGAQESLLDATGSVPILRDSREEPSS